MRIDTTEMPTTEIDVAAPALPVDEREPGAGDCPLSVVVLDDNAEVRAMLVAALRESGCVVTEATGHQAIRELVDERPFDAAVVDLVMPSVNGLDVLRELRLMKFGEAIKGVILNVLPAGHARDALLVSASELGGVEVVDKPVTANTLLAVLRRLVPSRV